MNFDLKNAQCFKSKNKKRAKRFKRLNSNTYKNKSHESSSSSYESSKWARTIYISNLPEDFTENDLRELMCLHVGDVANCKIFKKQNKSIGEGSVEFSKNNDAQKAIKQMHLYDLCDFKIKISLDSNGILSKNAAESMENFNNNMNEKQQGLLTCLMDLKCENQDKCQIFVRNIDINMSPKKIKDFFKQAGQPIRVNFFRHRITKRLMGQAEVEFETEFEASTAVSMLNGRLLGKKKLEARIDLKNIEKIKQNNLPKGLKSVGKKINEIAFSEIELDKKNSFYPNSKASPLMSLSECSQNSFNLFDDRNSLMSKPTEVLNQNNNSTFVDTNVFHSSLAVSPWKSLGNKPEEISTQNSHCCHCKTHLTKDKSYNKSIQYSNCSNNIYGQNLNCLHIPHSSPCNTVIYSHPSFNLLNEIGIIMGLERVKNQCPCSNQIQTMQHQNSNLYANLFGSLFQTENFF